MLFFDPFGQLQAGGLKRKIHHQQHNPKTTFPRRPQQQNTAHNLSKPQEDQKQNRQILPGHFFKAG